MRVRLSDPTLIEEFIDFLWRSGFVAEQEGADVVAVSVPVTPNGRWRKGDADMFLTVWLEIGLRVWKELWPDSDAIVLPEREPSRRAS